MIRSPVCFLLCALISFICASEDVKEPEKVLFVPAEEKIDEAESKYYDLYLHDPGFIEHKHKYDKYHGPHSQTLKPIAAIGDPHEFPDKLKIYQAIKGDQKHHHYVPEHEIVTLKPIGVGHDVNFGQPGLYQDLYKDLDNERHRAEYNKDLYLLDQQNQHGVPYATGVAHGYHDNPVVIDKPIAYGYPVGYEHTQYQIPHHTEGHYYQHEEKKEDKKHYSLNDYKKKKLLKPLEWLLKAKQIFWKL